jgi:hypothetical protein
MTTFDVQKARNYINLQWSIPGGIVPSPVLDSLYKYIRVPNQSPQYPGYLDADAKTAAGILRDWVNSYNIKTVKAEVKQSTKPIRTPILLVTVDGTKSNPTEVLMYGHFDKQPPMEPWSGDLKPYLLFYLPFNLFSQKKTWKESRFLLLFAYMCLIMMKSLASCTGVAQLMTGTQYH